MKNQKQKLNLVEYRTLGLPLLVLMALIGLGGVILLLIVNLIF